MATQALGASTRWACDINCTSVEAYNVAHSHARTSPAKCHPIELRTQWAKHTGPTSFRWVSRARRSAGWESAKATGTRGAKPFSISSSCVGCSALVSWSWSVSGPSSRTPSGWNRSVSISAAWGTVSLSGSSRLQNILPRSAPGVSLRLPGTISGTWSRDRSRFCSRARSPPGAPPWSLRGRLGHTP